MLKTIDLINQLRRPYMSGIERSEERVNKTHEFFTPSELLIKINDWLDNYDVSLFSIDKTFIDHSCGDGQILSEVMIRKIEKLNKEQDRTEISLDEFKLILSTIYGVDLMIDNVDLCRERLLCGQNHLRHIVEQNIYQADSLKFSYDFCPMSATRKKREEKLRRQVEKEKLKAQKEAQAKEVFDRMFKEEKPKKKPKEKVMATVSA